MKEMGKRIKQKREELHMTCEDLGRKLGVNKSTISKYERGEITQIKRSHVDELAKILQCSPEWLMGFDTAKDVKVVYSADGHEPVEALVDISKPVIGREAETAKRATLYKVALDIKPENLDVAIQILKSLI